MGLAQRRGHWLRICNALRSSNENDRAYTAQLVAQVGLAGSFAFQVQALLALARFLSTEQAEEPKHAGLKSFLQLLHSIHEIQDDLGPHFADACYLSLVPARSTDHPFVALATDHARSGNDAVLKAALELLGCNVMPSCASSSHLAALAAESLDGADGDEREWARDVLVRLIGAQPAVLSTSWQEAVLSRFATSADAECCPWLLAGLGASSNLESATYAHSLCLSFLEEHAQHIAAEADPYSEHSDNEVPGAFDDSSHSVFVISCLRVSTRLASKVPGVCKQQIDRLADVADIAGDASVFRMAVRCLNWLFHSPATIELVVCRIAFFRAWRWLERVLRESGPTQKRIETHKNGNEQPLERPLSVAAAVGLCSLALQSTKRTKNQVIETPGMGAARGFSSSTITVSTSNSLKVMDATAWQGQTSEFVSTLQSGSILTNTQNETSRPDDYEIPNPSQLTSHARTIMDITKEAGPSTSVSIAIVDFVMDVCAVSSSLSLMREALPWILKNCTSIFCKHSTFRQKRKQQGKEGLSKDRRIFVGWLRGRFEGRLESLLRNHGKEEDYAWFVEFVCSASLQSSLLAVANSPVPESPLYGWLAAVMYRVLTNTQPRRLLLRLGARKSSIIWLPPKLLAPWAIQCWSALLSATSSREESCTEVDGAHQRLATEFRQYVTEKATEVCHRPNCSEDVSTLRLLFRCGALAASRGFCEEARRVMVGLAAHMTTARMRDLFGDLGKILGLMALDVTASRLGDLEQFGGLRIMPALHRVVIAQWRLRVCCQNLREVDSTSRRENIDKDRLLRELFDISEELKVLSQMMRARTYPDIYSPNVLQTGADFACALAVTFDVCVSGYSEGVPNHRCMSKRHRDESSEICDNEQSQRKRLRISVGYDVQLRSSVAALVRHCRAYPYCLQTLPRTAATLQQCVSATEKLINSIEHHTCHGRDSCDTNGNKRGNLKATSNDAVGLLKRLLSVAQPVVQALPRRGFGPRRSIDVALYVEVENLEGCLLLRLAGELNGISKVRTTLLQQWHCTRFKIHSSKIHEDPQTDDGTRFILVDEWTTLRHRSGGDDFDAGFTLANSETGIVAGHCVGELVSPCRFVGVRMVAWAGANGATSGAHAVAETDLHVEGKLCDRSGVVLASGRSAVRVSGMPGLNHHEKKL